MCSVFDSIHQTSSRPIRRIPSEVYEERDYTRFTLNDSFSSFVESVEKMEQTVLVPNLLKDIECTETCPPFVSGTSCLKLYDMYNLMKRCRTRFSQLRTLDFDDEDDLIDFEEGLQMKILSKTKTNHQIEDKILNKKEIEKSISQPDSGHWSLGFESSDESQSSGTVTPTTNTRQMDLNNNNHNNNEISTLMSITSNSLMNLSELFTELSQITEFITRNYLRALNIM